MNIIPYIVTIGLCVISNGAMLLIYLKLKEVYINEDVLANKKWWTEEKTQI